MDSIHAHCLHVWYNQPAAQSHGVSLKALEKPGADDPAYQLRPDPPYP